MSLYVVPYTPSFYARLMSWLIAIDGKQGLILETHRYAEATDSSCTNIFQLW